MARLRPKHDGPLTRAFFPALWLFIAYVSVYDGYLVAIYQDVINEFNPIGRRLLSAAGGEIWYLVAAKAAGTVLACSLLLLLFWHDRRRGAIVLICVAAFQLGLLLFLMFF
jgi:hypothetical protein